jgi:hypothetical protein
MLYKIILVLEMLKFPGTLYVSRQEKTTETLKYTIGPDITVEIIVDGDKIINVSILQGDKVIASNIGSNVDGVTQTFVSDRDLLVLDMSLDNGFYYAALGNLNKDSEPYIRGIRISDLLPELDYEVVMDYINLIETNDPDAANLTEILISASQKFDTFTYPDKLTLYCLMDGSDFMITTPMLNETFSILYQLASTNKYWMDETHYLVS